MSRAALLTGLLGTMLFGCERALVDKPNRIETYAKDCHTPLPNWRDDRSIREVSRYIIRLDTKGKITWSGMPIDMATLRDYAHQAGRRPGTELRLVTDSNVDCRSVRAVRSLMNETPMCRDQNACLEGTKGLPPPVNSPPR